MDRRPSGLSETERNLLSSRASFAMIIKNGAAPRGHQKVCPYCQSEIAIKAVRCPHCTSKLEGFPEIND